MARSPPSRFDALLDRLAQAEPGQYRHPPADMHVTVLSLFTVTDHPGAQLAQLEAYRAAVYAALEGIAAFEIGFEGITCSSRPASRRCSKACVRRHSAACGWTSWDW